MRNLGENQNLFQIPLIKINRDMFFFPFNKIYFQNPQNNFSFKRYIGGMILAFSGENYQESESQTSTLPMMPQGILFLVTSIFRLVLKQHFMLKIFINLYCKMHWSAKAIFTTS